MVTFRSATTNDVAAIVALVHSAYRGQSSRAGWTTEADLLEGQRTDPEAVIDIIETPRSRILLAEEEGELVGCCQLQWTGDYLYLGMFAVSPARQGVGLGRAIMAESERIANELGASTMKMTVISLRTDLIAWYERVGYAKTGATEPFPYGDERFGLPTRDDLEFVVMTKPVAPT